MTEITNQLLLISSDVNFPVLAGNDNFISLVGIGKIRCKGNPPVLTVTNPNAPDTSTLTGTDMAGIVNVVTNVGNIIGRIATITFNQPLRNNCIPVISPGNLITSTRGIYVFGETHLKFDVYITTAPADNDNYIFNYHVIELNS